MWPLKIRRCERCGAIIWTKYGVYAFQINGKIIYSVCRKCVAACANMAFEKMRIDFAEAKQKLEHDLEEAREMLADSIERRVQTEKEADWLATRLAKDNSCPSSFYCATEIMKGCTEDNAQKCWRTSAKQALQND